MFLFELGSFLRQQRILNISVEDFSYIIENLFRTDLSYKYRLSVAFYIYIHI